MYPSSSKRTEEGESHSDTDDDIHEATTVLLPVDTPPDIAATDLEVDAENVTNLRKVGVPPVVTVGSAPEEEEVLVPPDGGFGYVVLMGAVIVNTVISGTVKSSGMLFVEFMDVFGASPAETSWIAALYYGLYSSVAPLSNGLSVNFSHRSITIAGGLLASSGLMLSYFATSISFLCLSYGLIGGFGAGLSYPMSTLISSEYFDRKRGLAYGLCTTGSAFGSVVFPFLLRYLLNEYGYKVTVLIMGVIQCVFVCLGAMLFDPVIGHMKKIKRPIKQNKDTANKGETPITTSWSVVHLNKNAPQFAGPVSPKYVTKSWCSKLPDLCKMHGGKRSEGLTTTKKKFALSTYIDLSVLKDGMFLVILLSNCSAAIGYTNFLIMLPVYAQSLGYKDETSFFLSVVNSMDLFGRLAGSTLSDFKFVQRKWFYIMGLLFSGMALILLPMGESLGFIVLVLALFGLASGTYVGVTSVLLTDELGVNRFRSAYGISLFVNGNVQLVSPPSFGSLLGGQSSYKDVIQYLGVILIVGASFWIVTPFIEARRLIAKNNEIAAQVEKSCINTAKTFDKQGITSP